MIAYENLTQGYGDGYNDCFSCGNRLTITEIAKNQQEGRVSNEGIRVVRWCNNCYNK